MTESPEIAPLPEAGDEVRAYFLEWLETFSGYVRAVDYASARPLFHPSILAFGTHQDVLFSLDAWIKTQWDNVWPKTDDFRFNLPATHVLVAKDMSMSMVVAPWTSTGFHPDGSPFNRPGRATLIFNKYEDRWLVVHSHMSLNRGVPQASHGNRPMKTA